MKSIDMVMILLQYYTSALYAKSENVMKCALEIAPIDPADMRNLNKVLEKFNTKVDI